MKITQLNNFDLDDYPAQASEVIAKCVVQIDKEVLGVFGEELHRISFDLVAYADHSIEADLFELTALNPFDKTTEITKRYLDKAEVEQVENWLEYQHAVEEFKSKFEMKCAA